MSWSNSKLGRFFFLMFITAICLWLVSFVSSLPLQASDALPVENWGESAGNLTVSLPNTSYTFTSPDSQAQQPISIPSGKTASVDGYCHEYDDAASFPLNYAPGITGTVYLKHNGVTLYVCLDGAAGQYIDRFARVYLDTDNGREALAQSDDLALQVGIITPTQSSLVGTGVPNGYVPATVNGWLATATWGSADRAEYAIPINLTGGWCGASFGLAVYHHWLTAVGDDYGWPSNQWFDQPQTWQEVTLQSAPCGRGNLAYVYRGNTLDATSFRDLLTTRGYSVTLVPLGLVLSTDFAKFDLILIADDTGSLNNWGSAPGQVEQIKLPNKPILGLGEGGYAFFGQLSLLIGWPNGWHGPMDRLIRAGGAPANIYSFPYPIPPDPVPVYLEPVNEVGIYLGNPEELPPDATPIGLEPPTPDHASLMLQGCRQLWGFSGNPHAMTSTGQNLFINDVEYMLHFQCPTEPPPPQQCLAVSKIANPPAGTPVQPGDVISYTIVYTISSDVACENTVGKLVDTIPLDTIFVPGSASGGIAPGADGSLVWPVAPGAIGDTKTFQVRVSDTQCNDQRMVNNRAGLILGGLPPVIIKIVSHPVICPPVGFPNDDPPYAESEIQITPYPLVTGHPSQISVKVSNYSSVTQVLNVAFQTSANRFGIGLDFSSFDTKVVTVPAYSNVIVKTTFTPVSSGHYCIQVRVQGAGFAPIYTQHNIDVTEDLKAGVTDTLTFKVRNNSASTADINLVVVNTCPGWSAIVSPTVLAGMAAGEVRDAQLLVTPPNPATLGTACHIDVQGWIGGQLIGGIRKLDVPPVHLPRDYQPPWEEPEISVNPDPPVVGQPTNYCIQLQNPLGFTRTVTLIYSVADFGAGIGFTPIQTQTVNLPPYSLDNYCISWTPAAGGTLHRCLLVTLKQAGYQDETSQRNVNLVRMPNLQLELSDVIAIIRNPDPVTHTLELRPVIYGIDPLWKLHLLIDPGDPPPDVLGPNQAINLRLHFAPPTSVAANSPMAPAADFRFGDESKVEVGVYMDGALVGGFSADYQLTGGKIFIPIVLKNS